VAALYHPSLTWIRLRYGPPLHSPCGSTAGWTTFGGISKLERQSLSRQCALQLIIPPGFGFLTALWSCHDLTQRSRRDIIAGHQSRCCFEACGMSMYTLCTDSIFREYLRTRPLVVDRNYSPPELCDATVIMLYATGSAGICAYIHPGHNF